MASEMNILRLLRNLMSAPFVCRPTHARYWFKLRETVNWVLVVIAFIILVVALGLILPYWIAVVVVIAILFPLFFFVLDKRPILIRCPHCGKHLSTNTPWICGYNGCNNVHPGDFPFLNRCEHCNQIQQAYQCHHCKNLIFSTRDEQDIHFAKRLVLMGIEAAEITSPDFMMEKTTKRIEEKEELQHKLEIKKLRTDISIEEARRKRILSEKSGDEDLTEQIAKQFREYLKKEFSYEEAFRIVDAEVDKEPDEFLRAKKHAILKKIKEEGMNGISGIQ